MADEFSIRRGGYVVFNPETEEWESWALTPLEAFLLDDERFGVDVALSNLNWEPGDESDNDDDD